MFFKTLFLLLFQSTRPARGATDSRLARSTYTCHFNPRAPRGARLADNSRLHDFTDISIHAPREGRDNSLRFCLSASLYFNPRAPRGARRTSIRRAAIAFLFQSTRPARGATVAALQIFPDDTISIHAPREGRDVSLMRARFCSSISIHAPREGRDHSFLVVADGFRISIHAPREGRDPINGDGIGRVMISIHAPREGRDILALFPDPDKLNFNPRAPRGARLKMGRAAFEEDQYFNPRAPRGARRVWTAWSDREYAFQSTRPARGATGNGDVSAIGDPFQSTRPARGATLSEGDKNQAPTISIHAPREGRDEHRAPA